MARKPSERSHKHEIQQELNLAPFMSILVLLIPMLIFAFQFYRITVQSVAAPKLGTGQAKKPDPDEKPPLNLTVLIDEKGFVIKQQDALSDSESEPPRIPKRNFEIAHKIEEGDHTRTIPETVYEYDFPALYTKLVQKKKQYTEEDTINIGANFDIHWNVIARTIDCVRVYLEEESYTELEDYRRAKPRRKKTESGEIEHVPLFPKVVFVVAE